MIKPPYKILILFAILANCTIDVSDTELFTANRTDNQGDTISSCKDITWAFTFPIINDNVQLEITPQPPAFFSELNQNKDTLTLKFIKLLSGNTLYTVKIADTVLSNNGEYLYPNTIISTFFSENTEQEPNDGILNADTLKNQIDAFISTLNDTDYFYLNDKTAKGIYLYSQDAGKEFAILIQDSLGQKNIVPLSENKTNNYYFPDSLIEPIYIKIFRLNKPGYYNLGLIYSVKKEVSNGF